MTSTQVKGFKKNFVSHLNRLGKSVRKMKAMEPKKRKKIELQLYREVKKEANAVARIDKRYWRLAKAA